MCGIVFEIEENQEVSFEWGLDEATNNQAEALVVYQGLRIIDSR